MLVIRISSLFKCVYVLRFFRRFENFYYKYKKRTCPSHTSCGVRCTRYTKSFEFRFLFHPSLSISLSLTQIRKILKDFEISKIFSVSDLRRFFFVEHCSTAAKKENSTQREIKTFVCCVCVSGKKKNFLEEGRKKYNKYIIRLGCVDKEEVAVVKNYCSNDFSSQRKTKRVKVREIVSLFNIL